MKDKNEVKIKEDGKPIFTKKVGVKGYSVAISLPPPIMRFIEINKGDEVEMICEDGQYGKYIAFWKKSMVKKK